MSTCVSSHFLSPAEFWEAYDRKIGRHSIYEALRQGRIKHLRIGRKFLIPNSEIEDWPAREFALEQG